MPKFTDRSRWEWEIELTIPDLKKLRELGLDLNQLRKGWDMAIFEPLNDETVFMGVFLHLCKKQIAERNVSEEEFATGFNGDTIQAAIKCLVGAFLNFCQGSRIGTAMMARLETSQENAIREALEKMNSSSNESAPSTPASAESTPAPPG